jgi:putative Mn2+ efflux pump MntP
VALAFGLWDAVAPLAGMLAGRFAGQAIGSTGEYIGALALGAYGLYLLVRAWRSAAPEEFDSVWALVSLPLPLSLDNVAAGTSLGLVGFSPWLAAPTFGAITAIMSFAGLLLGRAAARLIRIRPDALTGVALVVMATLLALGPAR